MTAASMRHRPDDDGLPALFAAIDRDGGAVCRRLHAMIMAEPTAAAASVPLLAWPLIEAMRRAGPSPSAGISAQVFAELGACLDAWEGRFGLAGAAMSGPVSVAAQTWLVQDLHCLADLHNHFGNGGKGGKGEGAAWSARGHRAEGLLHRRLWHGDGYGDLSAEGTWQAADPCDALMPLLLLDTPAERVAVLAARAAQLPPRATAGPGIFLIDEGLRRHRRPPVAG